MRSFVIALFLPGLLSAQTVLKGKVADAQTGKCIPYASIGVPGKNKGTLSTEDGSFVVAGEGLQVKTPVIISAAGYESKTIPSDSLKSDKVTIALRPIKVKEFLDLEKLKKRDMVGNHADDHDLRRRSTLKNPGSEEAIIVENNDTILLRSFSLRIDSLTYDSVLLRVNFYSLKRAFPGDRLNFVDHYFTLTKTSNEVVNVMLQENLLMQTDFFASVECVAVYGRKGTFSYYTFDDQKPSTYTRAVPFGEWKKEKLLTPGFWFEVTKL
jgi:hypothetical protein